MGCLTPDDKDKFTVKVKIEENKEVEFSFEEESIKTGNDSYYTKVNICLTFASGFVLSLRVDLDINTTVYGYNAENWNCHSLPDNCLKALKKITYNDISLDEIGEICKNIIYPHVQEVATKRLEHAKEILDNL